MITKIVLKNFMSHARTVLELGPGLNVVIGPNNCGKSAIVAALQAVVGGSKGDFMVRHGQKQASVTVHTSEGHVIKWRRRRAVSYVINGREVHRVGLSTPEDLHDFLRLPLVTLDDRAGRTIDIHIADQKNPIFLLNSSPADAAAFFASSTDGAYVMEMQRLHRQRTQERRRDAERLGAQQAALDLQLAALAPLEDLAVRALALQHEEDALALLGAQIEHICDQIQSLQALEAESAQRAAHAAALVSLCAPPDLPSAAELELHLLDLQKQTPITEIHRRDAEALCGLEPPPELPPLDALERLLEQLQHQAPITERHRATAKTLAPLKPLADLPDPDPLQRLVEALNAAARLGRDPTLDVLSPLQTTPDLQDLSALAEVIQHLNQTQLDLSQTGPVVAALGPLQSPPEPAPLVPLAALVDDLQAAQHQSSVSHLRAAPLAGLQGAPELAPFGPLAALVDDLERVLGAAAVAAAKAMPLAPLQSPPDLPDPMSLSDAIEALSQAQRSASKPSVLASLQTPPDLQDPLPLQALIDQLAPLAQRRTPPSLPLRSPPELHDGHTLEALNDLIQTLDEAQNLAAHCANTAAAIEHDWLHSQARLQAKAPGLRCPTCDSPLVDE